MAPDGSTKAEASLGAIEYNDDDYGLDVTPDVFSNKGGDNSVESKSLVFSRELRNITREVGDSLKVKCEVRGKPAAIKFKWFKNEAPLSNEAGRVKIKDYLKGGSSQWSILRFRELETLDTGFYRCEASNEVHTIKSTSVIKVNLQF